MNCERNTNQVMNERFRVENKSRFYLRVNLELYLNANTFNEEIATEVVEEGKERDYRLLVVDVLGHNLGRGSIDF